MRNARNLKRNGYTVYISGLPSGVGVGWSTRHEACLILRGKLPWWIHITISLHSKLSLLSLHWKLRKLLAERDIPSVRRRRCRRLSFHCRFLKWTLQSLIRGAAAGWRDTTRAGAARIGNTWRWKGKLIVGVLGHVGGVTTPLAPTPNWHVLHKIVFFLFFFNKLLENGIHQLLQKWNFVLEFYCVPSNSGKTSSVATATTPEIPQSLMLRIKIMTRWFAVQKILINLFLKFTFGNALFHRRNCSIAVQLQDVFFFDVTKRSCHCSMLQLA